MFNKLKSQSGITLIELMSTVVIIGIIAAMAVPRMQNAYDRMEFRSLNRDITSTIRLARSKSITDKHNYGVFFDNTKREIILFKKDTSSTDLTQFEVADSVIRVDTLASNIEYLGTDLINGSMVFRPNGSAIFSGGGNIITMKYSEDMIGISVINVLSATGRVKSYGYYY